jgi:hypothetical protein
MHRFRNLRQSQAHALRVAAAGTLTLTLVAFGCQDPRYTGAGVGAGTGAGVGAAVADDTWTGAAIGAGVGALTGYVAGDQLGQREDGTDYPADFHRHGEFEHTHPHDGPHEHDEDGRIIYTEDERYTP